MIKDNSSAPSTESEVVAHLIACPYCDSVYSYQPIKQGEQLICRVCQNTIDSGVADFRRAFIYALTAFILFIIANVSPFIRLSLQGEIITISVFNSITSLIYHDLPILALIVFSVIIIMPLWYLLAVLWVIISFRYQVLSEISRRFLYWLSVMSPWSMLEVYLVGVIVTLVKLMTMAQVYFQAGFWAFLALMLCSILLNRSFFLDDAIFQAHYLKAHSQAQSASDTAPDALHNTAHDCDEK